jgi:hypothetical protein
MEGHSVPGGFFVGISIGFLQRFDGDFVEIMMGI